MTLSMRRNKTNSATQSTADSSPCGAKACCRIVRIPKCSILLLVVAACLLQKSHGEEPVSRLIQKQSDLDDEVVHRWLFSGWLSGFTNSVFGWVMELKYRWKVPELYHTVPNPPPHTTAIVIGSGFGGAISALRLGQAGIKTIVLERGQDWPIDPWRDIHANEILRDGRGLWHRTGSRLPIVARNTIKVPVDSFGGVLDVTEYDNIEVWRGACVGGGSKIFTGVMIPPPREYFDAVFNNTVSFDEMNDVYYPRVRDMLNLSPIPDDILQSTHFAHSRVWEQQVTSAGYATERPDSIFNWDIVRDEMQGRSSMSAIIGMSNMGNSNGVKFDLTQNYLKEAKATGMVDVYSNQQVKDIRAIPSSSGYQVDIEKLSPSGMVIDEYSIECDYLFLAAGSVGTSELLVKAKAKDLIRGLNDEIGKGWGSNGDAIVTRSFNPIRGLIQSSPSAFKIHDADGPLPVTFESWYIAGSPIDIGVQGSLAIVMDLENRGHFTYDTQRDKVELIWEETGNDLVDSAARRLNNIIAKRGTPKSLPGATPLAPDVWSGVTAHPLGGAVLNQATDNYGRAKGASRLYVMDGAAIPGSTGAVNPSLTISALAERNIEQIILEDF